MTPYFSIIIPVYNRERFIARAINSCLEQDFEDFEIIVVDDGSIDKSVDVVKSFTDHRVKLICHGANRGVSPARNTGVDEAIGEWIIFLASDDELLQGALSIIHRRTIEVDSSICRLQFMVQMDTEVSPVPALKAEYWDYIKYIKWQEESCNNLSETSPIVKRSTFDKVRYSNDRTLEGPYHLEFMKQFDAWSFPDIVSLVHCGGKDRLSKPNVRRNIQMARDQSLSGEMLLKNHGTALKQYAPKCYRKQISGLATLFFLSGNRVKGIKYSFYSLMSNFLSLRNWVILIFGVVGPKPLAWLRCFRAKLSQNL